MRPAPPSAAKSHSARSTNGAAGAEVSFWRGLWNEPVALGLGLLICLRPWRDGLTFTAFNAYYFVIVLILGAAWAARSLLRPSPLRAAVPIGILSAFVATAWLTGYNAYAYDPASQGLQRIVICLLIFVIASNGLRTRRAIEIIVTAVIVTWLLNSIWTIFHYDVMLKGMRQILSNNPRILEQYFGVSVPTPEIKSRVESNRAFGTFLFPNALGAFLVLGLPLLTAALPDALKTLRRFLAPAVGSRSEQVGWHALGLGLGVGTAVLSACYFGNAFVGIARPDQQAPIAGTYRPFLFFLPLALVMGGATAYSVKTRGARAFGQLCMALAVPAGLIVSSISLWLSYSRGAALALAGIGTLAILLFNAPRITWMARFTRVSAATLLLGAVALTSRAGGAQDDTAAFQIPDPLPTGTRFEQNRSAAFVKDSQTFDVEGSGREVGKLADLTSFRLRTTYWQVGMKMFADNLWTGVGLGNFKTAYPKYQFLGAGDVETAHNDFLNYFCETGILGGSLFLAFWVYFGVWGARRILQEQDSWSRRWLAAIYAGTLAFTLHTFVDFDFQNPSLSMLVFIFAGLFFALANLDGAPPAPETPRVRIGRRVLAGVLGLVVVACTSSVLRHYFFELGLTDGTGLARLYYVGDRKPLDARMRSALTVWSALKGAPVTKRGEPFVLLSDALNVVPDLAELNTVGGFAVPVREQPGALRPLKPGESPPANTYLIFGLNELPRARELFQRGCEQRAEALSKWDESYPHDPELSARIFSWYELLFSNALDLNAKRRYALAAEDWARKSTERSPMVSWWQADYGKALWLRASIEPDATRLEYYRAGLDYYKAAYQLYPRKGTIAAQYGRAQYELGKAMLNAKAVDEGQRLMADGQAMLERAAVLDRYDELAQ